jgi:hypothetical protein
MERDMLDIAKIETEILKMMDETTKINREAWWHPVLVAVAIMGAGAALAKLFV